MQQDLFQENYLDSAAMKITKIKVLLLFKTFQEMTAHTSQSATLMSKVFFAHFDKFLKMILNRFEPNYHI